MKTFEISSKKFNDGMKHFKLVAHEIFPDDCVVDETGTLYNLNGITWIKDICEKVAPTLIGKSVRVEFLNDERTEIAGHGMTEYAPDGMPTFKNATTIGHFTNVYIDKIKYNGVEKTVLIGEGVLDYMCYYDFITKLSEDIENGKEIAGSIEFLKTDDNDEIIYKYGYKDFGRIPEKFVYSGFALLGVKPADPASKILELNNKEEINNMTEKEIKELVSQTVSEVNSCKAEVEACKKECESKIANVNKEKDEAIAKEKDEKDKAIAEKEEAKKALDEKIAENKQLSEKCENLLAEKCEIEKSLSEAKSREKISEMNSAIEKFTEDEKKLAQAEIDKFKEDPINCEINSIVNKIYSEIGKSAKEKTVDEQNSAKNQVEDIFSGVEIPSSTEDLDIFGN